MALATQCPHCHTTFRVAHDQLKLRAGLVRCGACKQIFNGIENLLRPEEVEQASDAAVVQPPAPPMAKPGAPPEADHKPVDTAEHTPKNDPLLRMTLMDFTRSEREPAASPQPDEETSTADSLEETIDNLQRKPWRSPENEDAQVAADALDQIDQREYEEPSFVRQGRRRQRVGRVLRLVMAIALPLLLTALLAQGTYAFRDQLAARFPQAKPLLANACRRLGCRVELPAQIDSVSLESSELQTLPAHKNTFVLALLLRNRGALVAAWPNMELTLDDADDKPLLRRAIGPQDYLADAREVEKGFAPRSEQPVKLYFTLSQLQASGYRVYLFYP